MPPMSDVEEAMIGHLIWFYLEKWVGDRSIKQAQPFGKGSHYLYKKFE